MKKAIVIGGFVNALGLIRSLHELGIRVALVTTATYDIAQYSRYVDEHFHLGDSGERASELAEWLLSRKSTWNGAAVYPSTDEGLDYLAQNREVLESYFRLVLPGNSTLPILLDRNKMMSAAGSVGILLPKCHGSCHEAATTLGELDYPVLIKPVRSGQFLSRFGIKLFQAKDRVSLLHHRDRLAEADVPGVVFDQVPGPDCAIFAHCVYMDEGGNPLVESTVRKLRQSPAGFGIARVAEIVPSLPELREQSIEMLRHMCHRGVGVVEFKYDRRDGRYRFMEVNGRSVVYNGLLRKAGFNAAALAWSDYVDGQAQPLAAYEWGGVWIHLHADILRSVLESKHDEAVSLRDYISPYRKAKTYAVWSARDPAPFRAQWRRSGGQFFRRLFRIEAQDSRRG